jgi:L-malate glycosyltransferase
MKVFIAHTADPYNPTAGGAVRYSLNLLQYLSNHSVDVTFLGVQLGQKPRAASNFSFVPVIRGSDTWYRYFINLFFMIPFLRIPKNAVIHTHRLEFMFVFALICPRNPKVFLQGSPPLHHAKLHMARFYPLIEKVYGRMESFCLRQIDFLITNKSIEKCYVSKYPWIKDKIRIMPVSAVDLNEFRPMDKNKVRRKYGFLPEDKIIIFLGRLNKVKNIDLLVKAYAIVKKEIPNAKLLIVGRGLERLHLEALSNEIGLRDVKFLGMLEKDKIPEILNCANVLALCTLKEGCEGSPTVIREAFACGVPAVSTDVGDVREIITSRFLGRIVGWDEKNYAEALEDILNNDDRKVESECLRASKEFGFKALAEKVVKVYQETSSFRNH